MIEDQHKASGSKMKKVKTFVVKGMPESNREIIDYTRNFPTEKRVIMERNSEDNQQLYHITHGFLNPFDIIDFFEDDSAFVDVSMNNNT